VRQRGPGASDRTFHEAVNMYFQPPQVRPAHIVHDWRDMTLQHEKPKRNRVSKLSAMNISSTARSRSWISSIRAARKCRDP
jgi:hypothetical protein